jgi:hypothetical protein
VFSDIPRARTSVPVPASGRAEAESPVSGPLAEKASRDHGGDKRQARRDREG